MLVGAGFALVGYALGVSGNHAVGGILFMLGWGVAVIGIGIGWVWMFRHRKELMPGSGEVNRSRDDL